MCNSAKRKAFHKSENATINPFIPPPISRLRPPPQPFDRPSRLPLIPFIFFSFFLSGASAKPRDLCRSAAARRTLASRGPLIFLFPFVRSSRSPPGGGKYRLRLPASALASPRTGRLFGGHGRLYPLFSFFFLYPLGHGGPGRNRGKGVLRTVKIYGRYFGVGRSIGRVRASIQ